MTDNIIFAILFILVVACVLIFVLIYACGRKNKTIDSDHIKGNKSINAVSLSISRTISGMVATTLSVYGDNYSVFQHNLLWFGLLFSLYDILKEHSLFSNILEYYIQETASRYFPSEPSEKIEKALHGIFDDLSVCFSEFIIERTIDHSDIIHDIRHKNDFCKLVLDLAFDSQYPEAVFISYRRSFLKLYDPLSNFLDSIGYYHKPSPTTPQGSNSSERKIKVCLSPVDDESTKNKNR